MMYRLRFAAIYAGLAIALGAFSAVALTHRSQLVHPASRAVVNKSCWRTSSQPDQAAYMALSCRFRRIDGWDFEIVSSASGQVVLLVAIKTGSIVSSWLVDVRGAARKWTAQTITAS